MGDREVCMPDPAAPRVPDCAGNGGPVRDSGSDPGSSWAVYPVRGGDIKKTVFSFREQGA